MAQLQHHARQMDNDIAESEMPDEFESPTSPSSSSSSSSENPTELSARNNEQALHAAPRPDLSAYASQTPLHDSMVFKVGGKGGLKRIMKRYFVLYPGVIVYYSHRTNYARDKKNGLKAGKVILLDGVYLSKTESAPTRMKYHVVLHTPHESNKHKEMLIGFHHKKDRNMWIELLQTQNPELGPSPNEESGNKKKLPLYIQKMREIDYYDPKSRYHMSRLHSVPTMHHSSLSSQDLQSLRTVYQSFNSLPADYRPSSSSPALYREHRQLSTSETNSEAEENGRVVFEVISEEEGEESDS